MEETERRISAGDVFRQVALPAFLLPAILLGGSFIGGSLASGIMQLVGGLVIVWVILDGKFSPLKRTALWIAGVGIAFVVAGAVQLIPLPPELWSSLPGRAVVAEAFEITGAPVTAMPISLAPQETLAGLLCFLPAFAVFLLTAKSRWRVKSRLFDWAIPLLAGLSALIGFVQVLFPGLSLLFPYGYQESGLSAGIMQLVNHNATLLLMAIPFVAVAIGRIMTRYDMGDPDVGSALMALALLALLIAGLVTTGSVAGFALAVPVLLTSALILVKRGNGPVFMVTVFAAIVVLGGVAVLIGTSPNLAGIALTDLSDGPLSRRTSFALTLQAANDHFPVGSGLGTFPTLYPAYEDPALVNERFIVNAHNDYLEVALELGLAGGICIAAGLAWLVWANVSAWRAQQSEGSRLRRAAGIAAFVVVFHSLADSPIRTETIACLFAYCLGILASSPTTTESLRSGRNSSGMSHKHIEI